MLARWLSSNSEMHGNIRCFWGITVKKSEKWQTLLFICKKSKGRFSKRVFQENKARQIFWKTNIFYPLDKHTYKNLICFVFLKNPFWDSPFCLITDKLLNPCYFFHWFFKTDEPLICAQHWCTHFNKWSPFRKIENITL